MSIAARDWAWAIRGVTHGGRLVLLALAEHADETGLAFPSLGRLAESCEMTPRNVQHHVYALRDRGLVRIERRARQSSRYYLALGETHCTKPIASQSPDTTKPIASQNGVNDETHFAPDTKPISSHMTKPISSRTGVREPSLEPSVSGSLSFAGDASRARARAAPSAKKPAEVPEGLRGVDEILRECRGYQPSARLWERIDRDYGGIDLEREALKLASWLSERPTKTASTLRILNWLDIAAKRQVEARATGPPRAAPSANGAYHGDGRELARAMAQERAEQAKRMQEAMAKRE